MLNLCWHHHREVHEGGFRVEIDASGEPQFYRPNGLPMRAVPAPPAQPVSAEALCESNAEAGLDITDRTLGTWDGYPMDYGWAVHILLRQEERHGGEAGGSVQR